MLEETSPVYLDERQLAKRLNISTRSLQLQRHRGEGIPYVKIGKSVRYNWVEVQEYLKHSRRACTDGRRKSKLQSTKLCKVEWGAT